MTKAWWACSLAVLGFFSSAASAAEPAPWRIAHQIEGYGPDALAQPVRAW